jgi:hypothetical protein
VVDVEEQPDVVNAFAALGARAVDGAERIRCRAQRVTRGAAHRLHEHGAPDALRGPRGECQVLGGELILLLRRGVVLPVAVERVEARQPSCSPNPTVTSMYPELSAARGPGDQAPVPAGHVAHEEVQPDELHACVGDRGGEPLHLGVGRRGHLPRPPELDRVEPRPPRGLRPFEQRQLGKQDREVDLVSQPAHEPLRSALQNYHSEI